MKHLSPDREEPCKNLNETKNRTQDWTKKLVGSIRRKVHTKKTNSTSSAEIHHDRQGSQTEPPEHPQENKVEVTRRKFTDVEEFELSPRIESRDRKSSLSSGKQSHLERKSSNKSLGYLDGSDFGGSEDLRMNLLPSKQLSFETCKIRRKLSFPSVVDACKSGDSSGKETKFPKKKDTTLLALIFKKQSSIDVKKDTKESSPTVESKPKEKPRKIPDFSISNPVSPGSTLGLEYAKGGAALDPDWKCCSDIGLNLNQNQISSKFPSGRVGSTPRIVSRSCGQVEMVSSDPAIRENFLHATMSIFLAVSPPNSKIQVNH